MQKYSDDIEAKIFIAMAATFNFTVLPARVTCNGCGKRFMLRAAYSVNERMIDHYGRCPARMPVPAAPALRVITRAELAASDARVRALKDGAE